MAKGTRGGRRTTIQTKTVQQVIQNASPKQAQVLQDIQNGDTVSFTNYMELTDDQKAVALEQMIKNDIPNIFDNSAMQKFLYYTESEGKPQVVTDSALNGIKGTELFRGVSDQYNRATDINYTSKQIYDQIAKGTFTRVSSTGGSAYGKGIYFGEDYGTARSYANYGSKNSIVMRAKILSNANVIGVRQANNAVSKEIASGSALGKAYAKMDSGSRASVWALNNGYKVMKANDNSGYNVVLDRSALAISSRTVSATQARW